LSFAAVLERVARLDNPYPGLRPFETSESQLFFGREPQVQELIRRLARNRFVAVLGVSGSGKSSLVRAGLIPVLHSGGIPEVPRWRVIITRPAGAPFQSLSARLEETGLPANPLRQTSQGLVQVARQLPSGECLLVVVDQFEELFRYKEEESVTDQAQLAWQAAAAEAHEYVQLLLAARYSQPAIYVVLTLRSDYLGDCAEFRDLPETLNDCQYLIPRMSREQRRDTIEGPLGRVKIAPSLVQRMLNDVGDEPNQLPILQHALMRTWGEWRKNGSGKNRGIQLDDYLAIGGFANALNNHADQLLRSSLAQSPVFWSAAPEQLVPTIAETIFKRLTARGPSRRERRDPATLADLWDVCGAKTKDERGQVTAVVDHFRQGEASFLTPREGSLEAADYVDITHESLIRLWKKLGATWVGDEEKSARNFLRLHDRATAWKSRGGAPLSGLDLTDALEWDRLRNKTSAWAKHYADESALTTVLDYISESQKKERKLAKSRRNLWLAIIVALAMAALSGVAVSLYLRGRLAREVALTRQLAAQSGLVRAESPAAIESAALLAIQSMKGKPLIDNDYALRAAIVVLPHQVARWDAGDSVVAVAFSKDGRYVVTGSVDNTARVYEVAHGTELVRFTLGGAVNSVAFSSDGRYVATGSADQTARVFEVASQKEVTRFSQRGAINTVAFSPNGRYVATGSTDKTARVFDVKKGKQVSFLLQDDIVNAVAFSPNGRSVVTASDDWTARVFETVSGRELMKPLNHKDSVHAVAFSPDGNYVATASEDHTARVFEVATGNEVRLNHGNTVDAVAFSPDGRYVATGSEDKSARVFEAISGQEVSRLIHADAVKSVAFSPDGRYVATGSDDETARVFETSSGREVSRLAHRGAINAVAFSPDGRYVATASDDRTSRLFEAMGRREVFRLTYGDNIVAMISTPDAGSTTITREDHSTYTKDAAGGKGPSAGPAQILVLAVSSDGRYLATGSLDQTARVFEVATGKELAHLLHKSPVRALAFSTDRRYLATGSDDWTARVFDLTSQKEVARFTLDNVVNAVFFSPDARYLATGTGNKDATGTGNRSHSVGVSDVAGQKQLWRMNYEDVVNTVAFSPDGRYVASGSDDGRVRVWEAAAGQERLPSFPQEYPIVAVAFSPNGTYLATGSGDKTARVYEFPTAKEVSHLIHGGSVDALMFSSDGRYLATGSYDHTARVLEIESGNEVSRAVLDWPVRSINFASDGRHLSVTAAPSPGINVSITRHFLHATDLIADACSRVTRNLTHEEWKQYVGTDVPYDRTCPNMP